MFSACGDSETSSLSDNEEIRAAQDEVPFTIILPEYLPDEYTFSQIIINAPPSIIANGMYTASLIFTNGNDGYLQIEQSNYEINTDVSDDSETIELSETITADFFVAESADNKTMIHLANFTIDEVGILIMARDLSRSEMIEVAKSLL